MQNSGKFALACVIAGAMSAGGVVVSCSGGDDSGAPADASVDVQHHDVAIITDDSGGPVVCAPELPSGYTFTWAPPVTTNTACTTAQIQAFYDACFGAAQTKTACDTFSGDPANSPCIACMYTDSRASAYGAIIGFDGTHTEVNLGGCIALIDGDAGTAGCGATYEAFQLCEDSACEANCPIDTTTASYDAFRACEADAGATVCGAQTKATSCAAPAVYAKCNFVSYEANILGVGQIMCASGITDGGADAADD